MSRESVAKWARDMWQMFESLPENVHSDRIDFEIDQVLIKHGIKNEQTEQYWEI